MISNPKVSVCMITYGHEKFLREAIDSVFMQETNFDFELIISNDASPDATNQIMEEICESHPNRGSIRYYNHSKNIGMMPNFIFALNKCQGEYIAICEGDDYWTDPLKLQKQIDFLETNEDYHSCFTNVQIMKDGIISEHGALRDKHKKDFDQVSVFYDLWIPTLTFVYRRASLLAFPEQFEKVKSGDLFLFYLLAQKGKIKYLDFISGIYRQHENGVWTGANKLSQIQQTIKTFEYIKEYFKSNANVKRIITDKIVNAKINILKYYFNKREKRNFLKTVVRLIVVHPTIMFDRKLYFFVK